MTEKEKEKIIFDHIKKYSLGLIATVHEDNSPEGAVIGISQKDNFELVFDTLIFELSF